MSELRDRGLCLPLVTRSVMSGANVVIASAALHRFKHLYRSHFRQRSLVRDQLIKLDVPQLGFPSFDKTLHPLVSVTFWAVLYQHLWLPLPLVASEESLEMVEIIKTTLWILLVIWVFFVKLEFPESVLWMLCMFFLLLYCWNSQRRCGFNLVTFESIGSSWPGSESAFFLFLHRLFEGKYRLSLQ